MEAFAEKREINSLQFLDLFFLFLVGFLHLLDQQLAGLVPEVVVTGIQLDLAVVDVGDLGTYLVQEVTVMGYYDNGILEINQEVFQPCDRIQIQMVGRLIQQQNVGDYRTVPWPTGPSPSGCRPDPS